MNLSVRNLFIFILFISCFRLSAQNLNVASYGAVGDGKTVNTAALQKTVAACFNNGGGTVYVPAGTFVLFASDIPA